MEKCGCGKDIRYAVGRKPDGEMILSCNKYKRCPDGTDELNPVISSRRSCEPPMQKYYRNLEEQNKRYKTALEHISKMEPWMANYSDYIRIAKKALEI